jgi:hypothetical protein
MTNARLVFGIFAILLSAVNVSATQVPFEFRPQQSVYIVAVHGKTEAPSLSAHDLNADREISAGFKKRGVFTLAPSPSKADFVFVCITEYLDLTTGTYLKSVRTVVLKPNDYAAHRSDLNKMLEVALWQNTRSAIARVKLKSVLNDFHSFALKKKSVS